jgi:hypothetical protein
MRLLSTASVLLTAATLLQPGASHAQRSGVQSMQGITAQAHYRIRAAEMCRQPDDAERQETASRILGWIDAEAARVGVSPTALVKAAEEGVQHAENRIGNPPSAQACEANTTQFKVFYKSMISQLESMQRSVLDMNARTHSQLRMAELCGDPDEAKRKELAARITGALAGLASQAGVLPDLLASNAASGARSGEAEYANRAPDACRKNASSLIDLGGG